MTIEQIDETRVLIALCREDMQVLSLEYNTMGFKDPYSRKVLKKLLALAGARTGVTVSNRSVMVEALPYDKGCLLVVTFLPKGEYPKKYRIKSEKSRTMYCFENCENLLAAAQQLYLGGFLLQGSKVFELNGEYFLIAGTGNKGLQKALIILKEYALKETSKKTELAKIEEHGRVIADNNAILRIGSAMCR